MELRTVYRVDRVPPPYSTFYNAFYVLLNVELTNYGMRTPLRDMCRSSEIDKSKKSVKNTNDAHAQYTTIWTSKRKRNKNCRGSTEKMMSLRQTKIVSNSAQN